MAQSLKIVTNERKKQEQTLRICFEIILSLAERYFGIDLRCQGAVNSGLFTSLDREKMPKRASDKPKKQILKHISDNFKTDSKNVAKKLHPSQINATQLPTQSHICHPSTIMPRVR